MSKKITVVALIGQLGRGGSERQLYLTMRGLDPAVFDRHVVVFNPSNHEIYDNELCEAGITVWPIPENKRTIFKRVQFLYQLFRKLDAKVVHSWTVHDNPYAALAGFLAGVPVRWGSLRGSTNLPGFQSLPKFYRYLSLHTVNTMVVNSKPLISELMEQGLREEKICFLPNAIEPFEPENVVAADLSDYGISHTDTVIGIVGNLRANKNHLMFIQAMAEVKKSYPDVRGVVVGQKLADEADLPTQLQQEIQRLDLQENIFLLGFRDDIPSLLKRFTLFCLTSRQEGSSNAVLEAMSAGCPVVATDVGGMPDLIEHGRSGLLVPSNHSTTLAEQLKYLLDIPSKAQELAHNAQNRVKQHYDCNVVSKYLGNKYIKTLGGR